MSGVLKVAVVGHTNTGKTSLLRTLMRDVEFGEVSDRPAVTRAVEAALLRAGGAPALELFDTPGLEDSIGLLETLEKQRGDRRADGIELVEAFLESVEARTGFAQEAKALRQVLASDIALYVVDVRDRVLGKHRDELTILGYCATPIVPVLNFTATENALTAEWREHLARVNMHAVAEFDTVVFDLRDEQRLYEKMRTLLDTRGDVLETLARERVTQRHALVHASSLLLGELLVDVAAYNVSVADGDTAARDAALVRLKQQVREREQACVEQLLALHRFRPTDVESDALPIAGGAWGIDLFSPAAMKEFGLHAGGAAATGAMVGVTFDLLFAGLTLGTAAAAGAAIGGLVGAARTHGRRLYDRLRGRSELRCAETTLRLLALRQIELIRALLRRGHASVDAIRLGETTDGSSEKRPRLPGDLLKQLARAQLFPEWSSLMGTTRIDPSDEAARQDLVDELARSVQQVVEGPKP
ncbi:MAG: GTPase/DUF3482 domain-containing protein [Phycisphaerales bacterium]|nr:GTPase/DUF3482 domain-containing protein [Phycisphaerales bacterium]NNM26864.1 GTPase/DUF3482 domain-containing protein [Phycisphaerales bacterium]